MEEPRICVFRILIRFSFTRVTSYLFSEELILSLAKPLPHDDFFFICTRLTEALSTYVTTFFTLGSYFAFPRLIHSIWCSLILSCYERVREESEKLFYPSGFRLSFFSLVTFVWVVLNVRHFLSFFNRATSTNLLIIKSQPKVSDYIMLTVRTLFIPSICFQVPAMVICLLESRAISFQICLNNRRISMVRLLLTAALFTPPDIWC